MHHHHFLPNGQQLVIRQPGIADAAGCLACFRQFTGETDFLLFTHEEAMKMDLEAEEEFIRSYIEHPENLLLVADVEGKIVGIFSLNRSRFKKQYHRALMGMAVLHGYWNMGIGRRLLTAGIRWAEGHPDITNIYFEVFANNERAIQLYRNFNFTEHGRIPKGIRQPNGEWADLIVMSKDLKTV